VTGFTIDGRVYSNINASELPLALLFEYIAVWARTSDFHSAYNTLLLAEALFQTALEDAYNVGYFNGQAGMMKFRYNRWFAVEHEFNES